MLPAGCEIFKIRENRTLTGLLNFVESHLPRRLKIWNVIVLRDHIMHHTSVDVGQAEVAAGVTIGQPRVVES